MMVLVMVTAAAGMLLVVMLMVVAAAAVFTVFVMMVMVLLFFFQLFQLGSQRGLSFHGSDQLLTGELPPGGGHNGSLLIVFPQHCHSSIQLGLRYRIGTGEDNGGSSFDLVVVELTEVLHIDLHLAAVNNCNCVAQRNIIGGDLLHSADNIGQFADTGGFNNDAVRIVLLNDLGQCLAEVTHQRAANASGVHLGNIDAGILQETAVNADFTELIFNQNQFLSGIGLLDHLLDEGGLTGAQKARININFHKKHLLFFYFSTL